MQTVLGGVFSFGNAARATCAILLIWAVAQHPYSYYVLLRWIVSLVAAYSAVEAWQGRRTGFIWLCAALGLIFNPLRPVHLDRGMWGVIDILAACALGSTIIVLSYTIKKEQAQGDTGG